jgi:hypothetical protein
MPRFPGIKLELEKTYLPTDSDFIVEKIGPGL